MAEITCSAVRKRGGAFFPDISFKPAMILPIDDAAGSLRREYDAGLGVL